MLTTKELDELKIREYFLERYDNCAFTDKRGCSSKNLKVYHAYSWIDRLCKGCAKKLQRHRHTHTLLLSEQDIFYLKIHGKI